MSRRTFLTTAAAAGLGVLAACTRTSQTRGPVSGPVLRVTGDREQLLAVEEYGMVDFPDGHITFLDIDGERRMWLAGGLGNGGGRTLALDASNPSRPRPVTVVDDRAVPGLVPVGGTRAFDSDYSGPGSVFPSADGTSLWLVYHAENHTFSGTTYPGRPFFATIGLAESLDGGLTWSRRGPVISGQIPRDDDPAPREVVGAGSPCAVVDGDTVSVLYVDWNLDTPDQVHLARVPLVQVGDPAAWRKWHAGSFSSPAAGGPSTAVVERPGDGERSVYAGNPSVSWNTYLRRWVVVVDSADGFWWSHSADLVSWAGAQQFLPGDAPQLAGTTFATYASLLTVDADTDRVTGRDAHLHLALGMDGGSHSLWRIPVRFDA